MKDEFAQIQNSIELLMQDKLPQEVVNHAMNKFTKKKIAKGDLLVHQGVVQKEIYFVISGLLRSFYIDVNGDDITRFFSKEGSVLCYEILFDHKPSNRCIEALEDSVVMAMSCNDFKKLIENHIYCMKAYTKLLERKLEYKIQRESSFLLKSATERYLDFRKRYPQLEKRINLAYIASYIGITPVSLSRIRRAIAEEI
ncbi:Crp/Fnr family transcriptional regulator [Paenibacillus sp. CMAA1739]|uniref:Crp/Fnr family transcriptional regulator n=1 Tax=Paenibacillus ottowii TaxID=2315729 RepID=UPI0011B1A2FC|nr:MULTISPECIES: Crp/Fnr family transcriptional regulator [Paenibacillus]MDP1509964.1 Crp/Fnr family transcriptional regulator [Paenibacillus ottowii]MEC4567350.1 Crp/Fnr family transcriptional regulator [Paenibacillus sp. CMAA1739]QDY85733.1 Crp/Fnr family transcriptional regulator [Paenibacillus polymyxa]